MKDMIIKLNLQDENLQRLLDVADRSDLPLSKLFEYFIEDLTHEEHPGSLCLEDWLCRRAGFQSDDSLDLDDDIPVTFSRKQVEIMNLLDVIMEN